MRYYKDKLIIVNSLSKQERDWLTPEGHGYRNVPDENMLYNVVAFEDYDKTRNPLGFIDIYKTSTPGEGMVLIAIHPKSRGKGLAKKLLSDAIKVNTKKKLFKQLIYAVDADNEASNSLIQHFDYDSKHTEMYNGHKQYVYTINF